MLEWEREDQRRKRRKDVSSALESGRCMGDLARQWGVSRPSVSQWVGKHIDPQVRRALAENGTLRAGGPRPFDLCTRLELIKLATEAGWTLDKLGMAIGCGNTALWHLVARHAPDGLDAAIADFTDEESSSPNTTRSAAA